MSDATYRKLRESGQYICPGSIFIPMNDGRCICGLPLEAHVWRALPGGVFQRVEASVAR